MNLAAVLGAFAVIFPLELPDKSLIAALVLSTRYRPWPVWIGVAAAFTVHVALAVAFGSLAALLPERLVGAVVVIGFAVGAAVLLFKSEEVDEEEGEALAERAKASSRAAAASAFGVIFVAEWGDLTQLMTANLVARSGAPLSVAGGALVALWAVAAIGIVGGRFLLRHVPLALIRKASGVLLAGLAVWTAIDVIRG